MVKKAVKGLLARLGYRLSRIDDGMPEDFYPREFGRVVYRVHHKGHCFYCYKGGIITEWLLTGRDWEFHHRAAIRSAVARKKGRTVIEAGANVGATMVPMCNDFPDLHFHLIEPVPQFRALLDRNLESFGVDNATLHDCALGARSGESITLQAEVQNAGRQHMEDDVLDTVTVQTHTLDELFPDADVAYLKVTVFGSEADVLLGARELVARCRPDISFEIHPELPKLLSVDLGPVFAMLEANGYERFSLYPSVGDDRHEDVAPERIPGLAARQPFKSDVLARTGS